MNLNNLYCFYKNKEDEWQKLENTYFNMLRSLLPSRGQIQGLSIFVSPKPKKLCFRSGFAHDKAMIRRKSEKNLHNK